MSREMPYQPMWKRKEVSFERMQEILKAHSKVVMPSADPIRTRPDDVGAASTENTHVTWKRVSKDAMESSDGYRVIKEPVFGGGSRYMAFFGKTSSSRGVQTIGRYDSFDLAKLGCDAHRKSALGAAMARAGTSEATPLAEEGSGKNSGSVG